MDMEKVNSQFARMSANSVFLVQFFKKTKFCAYENWLCAVHICFPWDAKTHPQFCVDIVDVQFEICIDVWIALCLSVVEYFPLDF